ncbi:MAG: hydrogenase 4 subunit F [Alphaproteobacteria bacterium]|nr:hydrogenase 4 subunit F [Alphaproteobacteria bacterium]
MNASLLLVVLVATPLVGSALTFAASFLGSRLGPLVAESVHVIAISIIAFVCVVLAATVLADNHVFAFGRWLYLDPFAAILVGLIGVVGLLTGIYSLGYLRHDLASGTIGPAKLCSYYGFFDLFLFTMLWTATANNIIMMWVGIEATTLGSAFLVGFYGQRASLEAAWKYVIICTVGVAFGLYGTVLVYAEASAVLPNPGETSLWTVLIDHAASLDPGVMRLAFVFVLVGFGTKAGLFPMHAWLPDAHSEAPSPVSALLSGVLVNCALFVLIRYTAITTAATGPGLPHALLLVLGTLSVAVGSLLIFVQTDLKRLLAYSTTENIGLIVLGFGIGGPLGVAAAILQMINHSITKTLLFCGSGNVLMKYRTRDLRNVRGLTAIAPATGLLLGAGVFALCGVPPFNIFVSEFMLVSAGLGAGYGWLMVICLLLLTITFAALLRFVGGSLLGPRPKDVAPGDVGTIELVPMLALGALVVMLGIAVPQPVARMVANATSVVLQTTPPAAVARAPWQAGAELAAREK